MQLQKVKSDFCPVCGSAVYDLVLCNIPRASEAVYLANAICPACGSYQGPWEVENEIGQIKRVGIWDPEPAVNPIEKAILN